MKGTNTVVPKSDERMQLGVELIKPIKELRIRREQTRGERVREEPEKRRCGGLQLSVGEGSEKAGCKQRIEEENGKHTQKFCERVGSGRGFC